MLVVKGIDKVILHMPKCGGSSVRWAVVEKYDYRWSVEHAPLTSLPDMYKDFECIGFCRNPADWYRSKYYHDRRYYQNANITDTLAIVQHVSNGFEDSFEVTLPRLLDIANYFDMNADKFEDFKYRLQRLAMNKQLARLSMEFEDLSELKPEIFAGTLYDYWYTMIGLDKAKVYKMDDGNFADYVRKEFPGVNIKHRNRGVGPRDISLELKLLIHAADNKYFVKHDYSV